MTEENGIKSKKIKTPANDLDFNVRFIEPAWGKDEVSQNFQDNLTEEEFVYDRDGNQLFTNDGIPYIKPKALWDTLAFITKDFRQGNLSRGDMWKGIPNEVEVVQFWAIFAGDMQAVGFKKCFIQSLVRAGILNETSLSINGMFMKNVNTFRQETKSESSEIHDRKLGMGFGK